ncbi:MAG TPA: roadblock/LC7 domain-containing protein [Aggregatilinea sp.]|jgi:predicted regulator of Ras-like GTPase activity (Roadblock/LC7/MglB family)|uniref:roadblock/LC7 domain-containing protein n=1 Tax=Aggregatilinea sp. TaxID=2806333 RepID=UPI002C567367|nr:roadblock/LC7 domain-containing protein [Aggregatilinea sp.]HML20468.1 roadblock/LC7 domain-containing protein [Aggregatilinea sp.]
MIKEYRSQMLERTLRKMHAAVPGIIASVIVNNDGLLVASYPSGDDDESIDNPTGTPQVAAMAATLMGLAERTLRRLEQGHLSRLVLESEEGIMIIYPADRAALAVLVRRDVKPGRVLYAASRARAEVIETLGG